MTGPVPPAALAAARAAVPFVNGDACRRILEAAAPAIEADVRERCAQLLEAEAENASFPEGSAGDMLVRAFTAADPPTIVRAFRGAACDPGPEGQHQWYCGWEPPWRADPCPGHDDPNPWDEDTARKEAPDGAR